LGQSKYSKITGATRSWKTNAPREAHQIRHRDDGSLSGQDMLAERAPVGQDREISHHEPTGDRQDQHEAGGVFAQGPPAGIDVVWST
jgi:hypothetical protein